MTAAVQPLIAALAGPRTIYDLARPYEIGMPQSPNHPAYWHSLPRRHGDMVRADGASAANDIIVMGTHVGTHIDALAHVSQDGRLHGDLDAKAEQVGGRFMTGGTQDIPLLLGRGVLLDVPAALDLPLCEPGQEITPDDLEATVAAQSVTPEAGDVILVRSGWGRHWQDRQRYQGTESGVPGVSTAGAQWLAAHQPAAVGADTIAFEQLVPGAGHSVLPAHRVLLMEAGINIVETLALEELAEAGVHTFAFVAIALPLVGATGSPVRALAITTPT
ncbi:cyclase family protein [soil metagenome]